MDVAGGGDGTVAVQPPKRLVWVGLSKVVSSLCLSSQTPKKAVKADGGETRSSLSLISRTVSVDVKHHEGRLSGATERTVQT